MGEAKKYKITFYFLGGNSKFYEVALVQGISEIRRIIRDERWFEIDSKNLINLMNVTYVEIE